MSEILEINLDKRTMNIKGESPEKLLLLIKTLIWASVSGYNNRGKKTKAQYQMEFIDRIEKHVTYFIDEGKVVNSDGNTYQGYIEIKSDSNMYAADGGTYKKKSEAYMIAILLYVIVTKDIPQNPDVRKNAKNTLDSVRAQVKRAAPKGPKGKPAPLKSFFLGDKEVRKLKYTGAAEYKKGIFSHEDCRARVTMNDGYLVVKYTDVVERTYIPDVTAQFKVGDIVRIRERFRKDASGKIHLMSDCPIEDTGNYKWSAGGCKAQFARLRGRVDNVELKKEEGRLILVYSLSTLS